SFSSSTAAFKTPSSPGRRDSNSSARSGSRALTKFGAPWALLSKIDELLLPEHSSLDSSDECYFLREYTAGRGFAFSETNNLISNFKKPPALAGTSQGFYKELALEQLAAELRGSLGAGWLKTATLVPIPPSKAADHPDHDDRLSRLLAKLAP